MSEELSAPGYTIARDFVSVARARDVAQLFAPTSPPFLQLLECRRRETAFTGDVLVLDVEVELPQHPVHAIHPHELIAVTFLDDDSTFPEVEALRADFPQVPHLNVRPYDAPKSLCLYEEPWADVQLHWSPRAYLERIREWLALTARGELHAPDQALEPFFLTAPDTLILSQSVVREASREVPEGIWVAGRDAGKGRTVLLAEASVRHTATASEASFVATAFGANVRASGVIRRTPTTLADLHRLLAQGGDDLVGQLRSRFAGWNERADLRDKQLVLVLLIPMTRSADGPEESWETWAFVTPARVSEVGIAIDLWQPQGGRLGRVMQPDPAQLGDSIQLVALNVVPELSRETAAKLNGLGEASRINVAAVGVGALGSQVCLNLARAGWGQWTYVDSDYLLPHNLARHALPGGAKGMPKAAALALMVNETIAGEPLAAAIVTDVLRPGESGHELQASLDSAELILDMSASIAVARAIALDFEALAPRVSIFLNPSGTDLVVLGEGPNREPRLDSLEMQYYRAVLDHPDLGEHLARPDGTIRYGRACRDVSSQVPQDLVALHASIGARAFRKIADQPGARISIFRADRASLTVSRIDVPASSAVAHKLGAWRLVTDEALLGRVAQIRRERLPRETGGVLLGSIDASRKIIYVVSTLPSPPDSREWPTSYIRGSRGLTEQMERVERVTAGQISYIGEWHSHPEGAGVLPSEDDRRALGYLSELRASDGLPGVFLIVGEAGFGWYLGGTVERS